MQPASGQIYQPTTLQSGNIQQLSSQAQQLSSQAQQLSSQAQPLITASTYHQTPLTTTQINPTQLVQPVSTTTLTQQPPLVEPSLASSQNLGTSQVVQPTEEQAFGEMEKIKYEFGKIRGVEVLRFKDAELEKTLGNNKTSFAAVGILSVLYFENYDRFVLSLNDWKYALLKRIPIVSSELTLVGPVYYTLPTYNGFYTLKLTKIPHMEALKNLETIMMNNSKLTYKGQENILGRGLSPDDRFRGNIASIDELPLESEQPGEVMPTDLEHAHPGPLSRKDKLKRGFKKIGFAMTGRLSRKGKHNLNQYQTRDIESIKATTPIMAPFYLYPRKEVERWINYNKEIAFKLNFTPELLPEGEEFPQMRSRAYGSVDLGQGYLSGVHPSLTEGITTNRPTVMPLTSSVAPIYGKPYMGMSRPKFTDKLKAKIPGEHHYHGEVLESSKSLIHQGLDPSTISTSLPGATMIRESYSNPPLTEHYQKNFGEPIHYAAENLTTNAPLKSQNVSTIESVPQTLTERVSSVLAGTSKSETTSIQNVQTSTMGVNQEGTVRRDVNVSQPPSNFEALRSQENMAPYQG